MQELEILAHRVAQIAEGLAAGDMTQDDAADFFAVVRNHAVEDIAMATALLRGAAQKIVDVPLAAAQTGTAVAGIRPRNPRIMPASNPLTSLIGEAPMKTIALQFLNRFFHCLDRLAVFARRAGSVVRMSAKGFAHRASTAG